MEVVTGPSEQVEQPVEYTDIYQAPANLRMYKSARLSLQQVNAIIKDAYDNKIESGDTFIPDYGGAKKRFEERHMILNSFWVERK